MPSPNATPTPITPPRVPLIDPRTGLIDRAWYLFFLSLFSAAQSANDLLVAPNTISLLASYDAALQALAQEVETQPLPIDLSAELMALKQEVNTQFTPVNLSAELIALKQEVQTTPRLEIGTIASQNADNVNITGGKISGLIPPLPVPSGGTGQSTYTNGQLLIGNTGSGSLSVATLTAGSNITITDGAGSITIDASFSTTGSTGSVTLAKITGLGVDGSLTFSNGLITAFTAPT